MAAASYINPLCLYSEFRREEQGIKDAIANNQEKLGRAAIAAIAFLALAVLAPCGILFLAGFAYYRFRFIDISFNSHYKIQELRYKYPQIRTFLAEGMSVIEARIRQHSEFCDTEQHILLQCIEKDNSIPFTEVEQVIDYQRGELKDPDAIWARAKANPALTISWKEALILESKKEYPLQLFIRAAIAQARLALPQ